MKYSSVTLQIKAIEQYFSVEPFVFQYSTAIKFLIFHACSTIIGVQLIVTRFELGHANYEYPTVRELSINRLS